MGVVNEQSRLHSETPHRVDYHDTLQVSVHLRGGVVRSAPFSTPWRRLHTLLLEWSDNGSWLLERAGADPVRTRPGEILTVPAGVLHRLRVDRDAQMTTTWIMPRALTGAGTDHLSELELPAVLPASAGVRIKALLAELAQCRTNESLQPLASAHRLCATLVEELSRLALASSSPRAWGDPRIAPILTYIRTHMADPIGRDSLASVANLSPTRFHYIFKQATESAPMDYVRAERVRRAQELLITTRLSVHQIADRCGFRTPQYFNVVFRKLTGYTPGAFRANLRGEG